MQKKLDLSEIKFEILEWLDLQFGRNEQFFTIFKEDLDIGFGGVAISVCREQDLFRFSNAKFGHNDKERLKATLTKRGKKAIALYKKLSVMREL